VAESEVAIERERAALLEAFEDERRGLRETVLALRARLEGTS
jgi:hypothetical protein